MGGGEEGSGCNHTFRRCQNSDILVRWEGIEVSLLKGKLLEREIFQKYPILAYSIFQREGIAKKTAKESFLGTPCMIFRIVWLF